MRGNDRCLLSACQAPVEHAAVFSIRYSGLDESCDDQVMLPRRQCGVQSFVVTAALVLNDDEGFFMDERVINRNKEVVEGHAEPVWTFL